MAEPIVDVKVGMNDKGEPVVTEALNSDQVKAFAEASAAKKVGTPAPADTTTAPAPADTTTAGGSSKGGKSKRNRKSKGRKSRKAKKSLRRK